MSNCQLYQSDKFVKLENVSNTYDTLTINKFAKPTTVQLTLMENLQLCQTDKYVNLKNEAIFEICQIDNHIKLTIMSN